MARRLTTSSRFDPPPPACTASIEVYLRDLFRVLPHWPRDRYLELAPRDWAVTRAGLDAEQLAREFGPLTVPAPPAALEQPAAG
ncbi:MAG: hypothetical protein R3B06_20450 [Kofleriaceae bacterium]